jgi:peptide/nickel transport system substrate-binding protein
MEIVEKGILSMDRISTLNPVTSKDRDVYYLNKLLYRSLFQLDETLKAREDLVRSFQLDEGARTLTLKLKEDARWADGSSIRPEDVQFSIEAYKRASYTGQTLYQTQVTPILQVRIQDDSIILRYGRENEFSLEDLTFPILNQKSYRDFNQALKSDINMLPMTSGPYKITSFNPYSELILEGNGGVFRRSTRKSTGFSDHSQGK